MADIQFITISDNNVMNFDKKIDDDITIENCGITKSPLDAYRYRGNRSGITDNNAPLSIKQKEQQIAYAMDIAGNNVPIDPKYIPTITTSYIINPTGNLTTIKEK